MLYCKDYGAKSNWSMLYGIYHASACSTCYLVACPATLLARRGWVYMLAKHCHDDMTNMQHIKPCFII